jgi:hypothetical protein
MMRQIVTAISGLLCLVLLIWPSSIAQEKRFYFYKSAQTRGSDAAFTPLTLLINGSFDALRLSPDAGREFVMRYALPFAERYAPFICWGGEFHRGSQLSI